MDRFVGNLCGVGKRIAADCGRWRPVATGDACRARRTLRAQNETKVAAFLYGGERRRRWFLRGFRRGRRTKGPSFVTSGMGPPGSQQNAISDRAMVCDATNAVGPEQKPLPLEEFDVLSRQSPMQRTKQAGTGPWPNGHRGPLSDAQKDLRGPQTAASHRNCETSGRQRGTNTLR